MKLFKAYIPTTTPLGDYYISSRYIAAESLEVVAKAYPDAEKIKQVPREFKIIK